MAQTSVAQFAVQLKMPVASLLEQLHKAGVAKKHLDDLLSEQDKSRLLEYLRKAHGQGCEDQDYPDAQGDDRDPAAGFTRKIAHGAGRSPQEARSCEAGGDPKFAPNCRCRRSCRSR
jgi:hypothetical protein